MKNLNALPILTVLCTTVLFLSGCSSSGKACENIAVAAEQVQQCQVLQRQISSSKGSPLVRAELERRYEQDCINLRYYRNDQQEAVCENKEKLKTFSESKKQ